MVPNNELVGSRKGIEIREVGRLKEGGKEEEVVRGSKRRAKKSKHTKWTESKNLHTNAGTWTQSTSR